MDGIFLAAAGHGCGFRVEAIVYWSEGIQGSDSIGCAVYGMTKSVYESRRGTAGRSLG